VIEGNLKKLAYYYLKRSTIKDLIKPQNCQIKKNNPRGQEKK
jgi:hypothetical protein